MRAEQRLNRGLLRLDVFEAEVAVTAEGEERADQQGDDDEDEDFASFHRNNFV